MAKESPLSFLQKQGLSLIAAEGEIAPYRIAYTTRASLAKRGLIKIVFREDEDNNVRNVYILTDAGKVIAKELSNDSTRATDVQGQAANGLVTIEISDDVIEDDVIEIEPSAMTTKMKPIKVTEEQDVAIEPLVKASGDKSFSDLVRRLLAQEAARLGVEWPDNMPTRDETIKKAYSNRWPKGE